MGSIQSLHEWLGIEYLVRWERLPLSSTCPKPCFDKGLQIERLSRSTPAPKSSILLSNYKNSEVLGLWLQFCKQHTSGPDKDRRINLGGLTLEASCPYGCSFFPARWCLSPTRRLESYYSVCFILNDTVILMLFKWDSFMTNILHGSFIVCRNLKDFWMFDLNLDTSFAA